MSGCFKRRGVPFSFLEAVERPKPLVAFQDRISRTWCCRRGRKHAGFFLGRCCTVKVSACMHLMCVNAESSLISGSLHMQSMWADWRDFKGEASALKKTGVEGTAAFNLLVANSHCTYQLCIFPNTCFAWSLCSHWRMLRQLHFEFLSVVVMQDNDCCRCNWRERTLVKDVGWMKCNGDFFIVVFFFIGIAL